MEFEIFTSEAGDLLVMCIERAQKIYGYDLPIEINNRLVNETVMLNELGLASDFLKLAMMMDEAVPEQADRYNVGLRDGAGSMLVSYFCGLSPFNPMELMQAKFYPEFYHEIVLKRMNNGKSPSFVLNVSRGIYEKLSNLSGYTLDHALIRQTGNLTLLENLQKKTRETYYPSKPDDTATGDLRTAIDSAESEGMCFWDYIPLLRDNPIVRELSYVHDIGALPNLSRIIGVAFGTGTCIGYVEEMLHEWDIGLECTVHEYAKRGMGFDIGRPDIITCPEDVYDYLMSENNMETDWKFRDDAKTIALKARIGSVKEEDIDVVIRTACNDSYINDLRKVRYLMDRSACVTAALEVNRLAYYWNRSSSEYLQTVLEMIANKEWKL